MIKQKVYKIVFRIFDGLDEFTCGLMTWLHVMEHKYTPNNCKQFWRVLDNRPFKDIGQPYD